MALIIRILDFGCIINDNVDLKNSILLSGNIKLRQMINIYKKSPNHDIIFIRFIFNGEKLSSDDKVIITELYNAGQYINRNLILSKDVPICEMLEAYILINGIHKKSSYFLFNANKLELNDNRKLIIFRNEIINIKCDLFRDFSYIIGKEIIAQSKINGKNINIKIGTLNTTKLLFDKTNGFGYYKKNLKKIYINKIMLTNENENCLYSLEIRENFTNPSLVLFGNKVDMDKDKWQITKEEAEQYAKKMNLTYFETSAKTKKGLNEGFSYIVNETYNKVEGVSSNIKIQDDDEYEIVSGCFGKKKRKKKKSVKK